MKIPPRGGILRHYYFQRIRNSEFTPKTVETANEREKLMFRVKAHIDPELLKKHLTQVKTGVPGMAYMRMDPQSKWPDNLQINVPK